MVSTAEIADLSAEERLKLIGFIWDSLANNTAEIPLTEAQRNELDYRIEDAERHPNNESTWDEVEARIRAKLCKDH